MNDEGKLRESLLVAYGIIREQTEQICDLHSLIIPLLKALENDSHKSLRESNLRAQASMIRELTRSKSESLALVDQEIFRLTEG